MAFSLSAFRIASGAGDMRKVAKSVWSVKELKCCIMHILFE